jgi:hypothetical protein
MLITIGRTCGLPRSTSASWARGARIDSSDPRFISELLLRLDAGGDAFGATIGSTSSAPSQQPSSPGDPTAAQLGAERSVARPGT